MIDIIFYIIFAVLGIFLIWAIYKIFTDEYDPDKDDYTSPTGMEEYRSKLTFELIVWAIIFIGAILTFPR